MLIGLNLGCISVDIFCCECFMSCIFVFGSFVFQEWCFHLVSCHQKLDHQSWSRAPHRAPSRYPELLPAASRDLCPTIYFWSHSLCHPVYCWSHLTRTTNPATKTHELIWHAHNLLIWSNFNLAIFMRWIKLALGALRICSWPFSPILGIH